ncbi:MAG: amino acid permease [Chlamydiia bacterium]
MGFWSVLGLVIGSQVGSGVFMSPVSLASYGTLAFLGWAVSGVGAVLLALVFAQLSMRVSRAGGPHTFIKQAFGRRAAFFMAWTYWVISWVSTTAVLIAAIGYLTPLLGRSGPLTMLGMEIALLLTVTALNLRGVQSAGRAEFYLSLLKVLPLILIPLMGLWYFQSEHLAAPPADQVWSMFPGAVALTFWGFIGIETATTAAGAVDQPAKTIPRAVVFGTVFVALLYMLNSVGVMGLIPSAQLAASSAPYADAARMMMGTGWDLVIGLMAFLVCVGTLNAWILTSGQIAAGAAQDGLFPAIFQKTNRHGAPLFGLLISSLGIIPMLLFTLDPSLGAQINWVIDISVTTFLFVYGACVVAFLKILSREAGGVSVKHGVLGAGALLFCLAMIACNSPMVAGLSLLFVASGIPVYLWRSRQGHFSTQVACEL